MLLAGVWADVLGWLWGKVLAPAGLQVRDLFWFVDRVPAFLGILVLFLLGARGLVWVLSKTFLHPERVEPMLASLVNRLLFAGLMFVGFAVALRAFGVNVFDLAITLGLVGAGLALGLQNTVANIMGGINLVSDRPFEVGDRVQIGDFWGDVEEIGLRSTRILTARREYVVIPNRLMDEREIWNYTKRYPELRLEIDVHVSYDSDVELARQLMLDVAEDHPQVLAFPEPQALSHGFDENGVRMQLRCFISDAREQYVLASDLRDEVKTRFREGGVEIPYPYRTLVEKSDLPAPAALGEAERDAGRLGPRRVLVAVTGTTPAIRKAETVVDVCADLEADIVLVHVVRRAGIVSERDGEMAADVYEAKAREHGLDVKLVTEKGGVVEAIRRAVDRESCGAVAIGGSPSSVLRSWKRAGIDERVREAVDVPVIVVPADLSVDRSQVQAARRSLDAIEDRAGEPP